MILNFMTVDIREKTTSIYVGHIFEFMPDPKSIGGTYWMRGDYVVTGINQMKQSVKVKGMTLYGHGMFDFQDNPKVREFWINADFLVNSGAFEHYDNNRTELESEIQYRNEIRLKNKEAVTV